MSTQRRKLSYYGIDFLSGEDHSFDPKLFCRFLAYINELPEKEKLFNDKKSKKAVSLDIILNETKEGLHLYKIVFKSCKYNHSPDYMSSKDGSDRTSDKRLDEGDKELTHMCMRIDGNEAYTIFEDRRNGVTIGGVISYFNRLFKDFLRASSLKDNFYLWAGIVPSDEFMIALDGTTRISVAEIFVQKSVLGSGYLDLMEVDASSQDDLVMTLKSKPRQSIPKRAIQSTFRKLSSSGTLINRIRIYGKDINKMNIMIDSLHKKKVDEVVVDLMPNGTVDSYSIFARIEEVLGVTE